MIISDNQLTKDLTCSKIRCPNIPLQWGFVNKWLSEMVLALVSSISKKGSLKNTFKKGYNNVRSLHNYIIFKFQNSSGKYQVANEKTQIELDKAHQVRYLFKQILKHKRRNFHNSSRRQSYTRKEIHRLSNLKF